MTLVTAMEMLNENEEENENENENGTEREYGCRKSIKLCPELLV